MILGFKEKFRPLIINGQKVHTIREDRSRRWEAGKLIHMATGVRTKKYRQFWEKRCVSVQEIEITAMKVTVDGKELTMDNVRKLATRDGFSSTEDFFSWFNKPFKGRLIHWTSLTY